jgi:general secretion pathway protein K
MPTGNRGCPPRRPDRGSALLTVLWLSAALAAIAFSLASTVRGESERTSTAVDGARSYYLATGAIQRAILHMLWGPSYMNPDGRSRFWTAGSPVMNFSFATGETLVEVIPEAARLNVNAVTPEDLFRLLGNLGVEPARARAIALAIVDWRNPAAPNQFSVFDQYYLSLHPTFYARHASFEEIEELLLVRGMTSDIYYGTYENVPQGPERAPRLVPRGGLSDCLSVFGSTAAVDVNTAAPAVLATIGVPPDLVAAIVARRRTQPFRQQDLAPLAQAAGPAGGRLRIGGNSMYTLRATARLRLADGRLSDLKQTVAATIKFLPPEYDARYHILRWYEHAWSY